MFNLYVAEKQQKQKEEKQKQENTQNRVINQRKSKQNNLKKLK